MTTERQELWTRLNAALDDRRDPWLDPALASALAGSPVAAVELAVLQRRLELLPAGPRSSRRRPRHVAVAATVLAATALGAWLWLRPHAEPSVVVYDLHVEAGAPLARPVGKLTAYSEARIVAGPDSLDDARVELVYERRSWK